MTGRIFGWALAPLALLLTIGMLWISIPAAIIGAFAVVRLCPAWWARANQKRNKPMSAGSFIFIGICLMIMCVLAASIHNDIRGTSFAEILPLGDSAIQP